MDRFECGRIYRLYESAVILTLHFIPFYYVPCEIPPVITINVDH